MATSITITVLERGVNVAAIAAYAMLERDPLRRKYETRMAFERAMHYAGGQVQHALREGRLVRPSCCSRCQTPCTPQGHHEDYRRPLDVVWLCHRCHLAHHVQLRKHARATAVEPVVEHEYLTTREAMGLLGVSRRDLVHLQKSRRLPHTFRLNGPRGHLRFARKDIKAVLATTTQEAI